MYSQVSLCIAMHTYVLLKKLLIITAGSNATGNPRNSSQSLSQYYCLFLITPLKVDHWLEFSMNSLENASDVNSALVRLNKSLAPVTFLVGPSVTLADFAVWAALKGLQIVVRCVQNCKQSVAGGFQ